MRARYQVLGPIATGGMAEVFRVRAIGEGGFEKVLAMKRIAAAAGADEEAVKMLMDEARIAARLNHPNIVQVFDFDRDEQGEFLLMEYVEGPDLATVLRERQLAGRRLDEACSTWIAIHVLRALDYAHKRADASGKRLNIVHRDVSPGNILVTDEGAVKLSDFGIAYAIGRLQQTGVGVLKGKLAYMSPEQARGYRVDFRSDIFSASLVLWECLAGNRCYDAPDELDLIKRVQHGRVRSFEEVGIEVPPALDAIVMKGLSREPEWRYPSAGEMAELLERYHRKAHPDFSAEHMAAALSATVPGVALPPEWTRVTADPQAERTRIEMSPLPKEETIPVVHVAPPDEVRAAARDPELSTRALNPRGPRRPSGEIPARHETGANADEVMAEVAKDAAPLKTPSGLRRAPPPPPVENAEPTPAPIARRVTGSVPALAPKPAVKPPPKKR